MLGGVKEAVPCIETEEEVEDKGDALVFMPNLLELRSSKGDAIPPPPAPAHRPEGVRASAANAASFVFFCRALLVVASTF